jgi:hypothetical protein
MPKTMKKSISKRNKKTKTTRKTRKSSLKGGAVRSGSVVQGNKHGVKLHKGGVKPLKGSSDGASGTSSGTSTDISKFKSVILAQELYYRFDTFITKYITEVINDRNDLTNSVKKLKIKQFTECERNEFKYYIERILLNYYLIELNYRNLAQIELLTKNIYIHHTNAINKIENTFISNVLIKYLNDRNIPYLIVEKGKKIFICIYNKTNYNTPAAIEQLKDTVNEAGTAMGTALGAFYSACSAKESVWRQNK